MSTSKEKATRRWLPNQAKCLILLVLGALRAEDTEGVAHSKRVALSRFISDVPRVEIAIHSSTHRCPHEVLQSVGYIGGEEPAVRVGQEVVDRVAFWDRTVVLDGVYVVVVSADTEFGF